MDAANQVPGWIASLQEFLNPAFRFRQLDSKRRIQFVPESGQYCGCQVLSAGHKRRGQHKLGQFRVGGNGNVSFWRLCTGVWQSADASYIMRGKPPPVGQSRGKGDADFICTQLEKTVSRSAGERVLKPSCKSGFKPCRVIVLYECQIDRSG